MPRDRFDQTFDDDIRLKEGEELRRAGFEVLVAEDREEASFFAKSLGRVVSENSGVQVYGPKVGDRDGHVLASTPVPLEVIEQE